MKKTFFFLLALLMFFAYACNFQLPTAIEIRGTPELRFAANFSFGEFLAELFDGLKGGETDDTKLLECVNTDIQTFLIYMTLYDDALPISSLGGDGSTTSNEVELANNTFTIPALGFNDFDFITGFSLASTKAKIYISGSSIVDILTIELDSKKYNKTSASGLGNLADNKYTGSALPAGGNDIELQFDGNEKDIAFKVLIESGKTITNGMTTNPSVKIELAVWLPLEFIADIDGAELALPGDLFQEEDLFGREKQNDDNQTSDMIESLSMAIRLNKNPFSKAALIVESGGISIEQPITGNSLEFAINPQKMQEINNNYPFSPKLKIRFAKGGTLSFPRIFHVTELYFKAKINYKIDLTGKN